MGLFNWLFSKPTPTLESSQVDNLEVDIVSKTLYEKVIESVEKKQTAFDYVLENFNWVSFWYNNTSIYSKHKQDYELSRKKFTTYFGCKEKPMFVVKNFLIYDGYYILINKEDSNLQRGVAWTERGIRPPVFRIIKDIYDNFCDWEYKRTTEYKFTSLKKLILDQELDITGREFTDEYSKNGVTICVVSKYLNRWYPDKTTINFSGTVVDVSEDELMLIRLVFNEHFNNIKTEEEIEKERKDDELRNELDAAIAAVLQEKIMKYNIVIPDDVLEILQEIVNNTKGYRVYLGGY